MHTHTDLPPQPPMSKPHPSDTAAALEWAVKQAESAAATDVMVRLNYLPALRHERDKALREARGS